MKTSKKAWKLTKPWEKAVCIFGIPILINTVAAMFFTSRIAIVVALLVTVLFIYDVAKRKRGKVIWDLDDRWERIVYAIAWASLILAIALIMLSFFTNAFKF